MIIKLRVLRSEIPQILQPFIGRREEAVKTTPISTLDPLIGWSEQEIDGLMKHFLDPSKNRIHPSIGEWIT